MKKLLALVLALVMSMSLVTISNAAFKDADTIDNKEAVDVMNAIGVLVGDEKGNFNAKDNLTRAQAAKIVCVMLLGKDASDALSLKSNFTDVSGWAESYIAYCASQGIVAGVGDGKFDPNGKLTGYQFAKMLLVALGYDAELESMIGSDWQVNVAKLSIGAGLTDGLNIALSKVITRDEAAKMAFNALKADMVKYTNGTKIETGDGTKVTVNATRYKAEGSSADGANYDGTDGDGVMQFCEQYFPKLKLNKDVASGDDFGRPADEWVFENVSVGTYAKSPSLTYTRYLGDSNGKKVVKADLKNRSYAAGLVIDGDAIDSSDAIAALTGNGKTVEVYITDNVVVAVVAIEYQLTEIKKITKDAVSFKNTDVTVEDDDDLYATLSKMEKGDKIVLAYTEDGQDVAEAYAPTKVTGKYTKYSGSGETAKYTFGGEVYQLADGSTLGGAALNSTYTLYLDKFGYILQVDEEETDSVYAFVLGTSYSVNRGEYDAAAQLLFADGTKKWVDVVELDDNDVSDDADDFKDAFTDDEFKKVFVSYTEKSGKYSLTSETTVSGLEGEITKNNPTIFTRYTATSKTVFLVKNGSSYAVYTGIKNVPSISVAEDKGYVLNDGGTALMVVIDKSATTNVSDQVFVYNTESVGGQKDGSTTIVELKAIVNGEKKNVLVKEGVIDATGLYLDSSYNNDYIDAKSTNAAKAPVAGDITDVAIYSDAFTQITLKNGVLKIMNDRTVVANKVTADEFNAWKIYGASDDVKADTLSIDKTETIGADGDVANLESGAYVIVILDDDGYATDLYLYNVEA